MKQFYLHTDGIGVVSGISSSPPLAEISSSNTPSSCLRIRTTRSPIQIREK